MIELEDDLLLKHQNKHSKKIETSSGGFIHYRYKYKMTGRPGQTRPPAKEKEKGETFGEGNYLVFGGEEEQREKEKEENIRKRKK